MIILPHVLTVIFVVTLPGLQTGYKIVLTGLITASVIYYYRWHISRSLGKSVLQAVHTMNVGNAGSWTIDLAGQKEIGAVLLPDSFVNNWMVILNFKDRQNKRYTLLVPADAVSDDVFRQLKVRVRLFSDRNG